MAKCNRSKLDSHCQNDIGAFLSFFSLHDPKDPCPLNAFEIEKDPHPKFGFIEAQFEAAKDSGCLSCDHNCGHPDDFDEHDINDCDCEFHNRKDKFDNELQTPHSNFVLACVEKSTQGKFRWTEFTDTRLSEHLGAKKEKRNIKIEYSEDTYEPKHAMENVRLINQTVRSENPKKKHIPAKPSTNLDQDWLQLLPKMYRCPFCDRFYPSVKETQSHIKDDHIPTKTVKKLPEDRDIERTAIPKDALVKFLFHVLSDDTFANTIYFANKKILKHLYPIYFALVKEPEVMNLDDLKYLKFGHITIMDLEAFLGLTLPVTSYFPLINYRDNYMKTKLPPFKAFCHLIHTEPERKAIQEFYNNFDPQQKWDFYTEMKKHCREVIEVMKYYVIKIQNVSFEFQTKLEHLTSIEKKKISPFQFPTYPEFLQAMLQHYCLLPNECHMVKNAARGAPTGKVTKMSHKFELWLQKKFPQIQFRSAFLNKLGSMKKGNKILPVFFKRLTEENKSENVVYEYTKCAYDSCTTKEGPQKCSLIKDKDVLIGNQTPQELLAKTLKRATDLKDPTKGVTQIDKVEFWPSCKTEKQIEDDEQFIKEYEKMKFPKKIEPHRMAAKQGLVQGRNEVFLHLWEKTESNKLSFFEIENLLPSICYESSFPHGPELLSFGEDEINNLISFDGKKYVFNNGKYDHQIANGLILADVLVPKDLEFPLLPYRTPDGRVVFSCCRMCSDSASTSQCEHIDSDRALHSVFDLEELARAQEKQHVKVLRKYELLSYSKSSNFLAPFFKAIFSIYYRFKDDKIEDAAYVSKINSEMDFDKTLELDFVEREEKDMIIKEILKLGMDTLLKRLSRLGKEKTRTVLVKNKNQLDELFANGEIVSIQHLKNADNWLAVKLKHKGSTQDNKYGSIVLGSHMQSLARLKLFDLWEELNNNCQSFSPVCIKNDGLIFSRDAKDDYLPQNFGLGLGKIKHFNERAKYLNFLAINPNAIDIQYKLGKEIHEMSMGYGFKITKASNQKISNEDFKKFLLQEAEKMTDLRYNYEDFVSFQTIFNVVKSFDVKTISMNRAFDPKTFISKPFGHQGK